MSRRSELIAIASMLLLIAAALAPRLLPALSPVVPRIVAAAALAAAVYSILLWRREQAAEASTRELSARYLRESMPAMLVYVVALAGSIRLLEHVQSVPLRAAIAVSPLLPIAVALRATARYIRGLDELQRRIELEAVTLGSIAVAFLYLTGGFLQAAKVIQVSGTSAMLWVLPALSLAYGIAKRFVARHYD